MKRSVTLTVWSGFLLSTLLSISSAPAQSDLAEAAKKEGKLLWYGSMGVEDSKQMIDAFTRKYPFARVERVRGVNETTLARMGTERRSGGLAADVVDLNGFYGHILLKEKYVTPYASPFSRDYPAGAKDSKGLWTAFFLLTEVIAYNTDLVDPRKAPRSYQDLLSPNWEDKMVIESQSYEWYYAMPKIVGPTKVRDYMQKIAAQRPKPIKGHNLLTQLLAAGEFAVAITTYGHRVEQARAKGAPVVWVTSETAIAIPQIISLANSSRNPNLARLFMDFVLSDDGQEVIKKIGRIPASPRVKPNPPRLTDGIKLLYPDIIDGGSRYDELRTEFTQFFLQ